jgi:hypothetical protein
MSKTVPLITAALAVAFAALAPVALAKDKPPPRDNGSINVFISPPGQPFYAESSEPYPIVKWYKQTDLNMDGKLDIDEFRADATQFFKILDRDHDGVISSGEVKYYEEVMVPVILHSVGLESGIIRVSMQGPSMPGSIDPGGAEPGQSDIILPQRLNGEQGAVPFSLLREPEPVRSADRNFDFIITMREFVDLSDRHFHTLDVDNKGFLLLTDLKKTSEEIQSHAHR